MRSPEPKLSGSLPTSLCSLGNECSSLRWIENCRTERGSGLRIVDLNVASWTTVFHSILIYLYSYGSVDGGL